MQLLLPLSLFILPRLRFSQATLTVWTGIERITRFPLGFSTGLLYIHRCGIVPAVVYLTGKCNCSPALPFFFSCSHITTHYVTGRKMETIRDWEKEPRTSRNQSLGARLSTFRSSSSFTHRWGDSWGFLNSFLVSLKLLLASWSLLYPSTKAHTIPFPVSLSERFDRGLRK